MTDPGLSRPLGRVYILNVGPLVYAMSERGIPMRPRTKQAKSSGTPTGLWVPCELLTGVFGGPVRVTDADGVTLDVGRGQMGFCDLPLGRGKFAMRPAVLGKIVGTEGGLCV